MQLSQLDLFTDVMQTYLQSGAAPLDNDSLYRAVASKNGLPESILDKRMPIGKSGAQYSPVKQRIRWYQQALKKAGIIQQVDGKRGVWKLAQPTSKSGELHTLDEQQAVIGFSTDLGVAIIGSSHAVFSRVHTDISLLMCSPPYPLAKARKYGNPPEAEYVDWIFQTLAPTIRNLIPGGSIALNVSGDVFLKGTPARSLYLQRLILALADNFGLHLMDQFTWHNGSKAPGPIQWASLKRVQLNTAQEPIIWMTNDPHLVRSDNRRVLQPHTASHQKFIDAGGAKVAKVKSDGAYRDYAGSFSNQTDGRIPRNVLSFGHSCADQRAYRKAAREAGIPVHGSTMPLSLVKFLVEFLTLPGDLVVDPFAGSMTTPKAAEILGRRWIAVDKILEYVIGGANRFIGRPGFQQNVAMPAAA